MESKIVDSYVETYIKSLLNPNHEHLLRLETYAEENHVPIIQSEIAQYLKVLFSIHKPQSVLEIGTAIGYSGSLFAMHMSQGTIDTIELSETMYSYAEKTFEHLKTFQPNVQVIQHLGDAAEVIQSLEREYDLIFIDAAKGHYKVFFDLCFPKLKAGGIIVSDNVLYKGMIATDEYAVKRKVTIIRRMRDYLDYIAHHPELETTIMPMGDGLAISYKKGGNA